MERFAGILIEHYAGRLPIWLAPVQAIVLPVSDRHNEYASKLAAELREAGVRVGLDDRSESVGRKIRDAELGRYPYMLVVGDREEQASAVAVRSHEEGELGAMPVAEFAARVRGESEPR
jgi:threonyl-tRNA synthetase